jgi:anti-anti-sigma factor
MELQKETPGKNFLSIRVTGRVDAISAPDLEKDVAQAMTPPGARLILDLAGVDYMSSAGLRVLMTGAKAAVSGKGAFAVCCIQEPVRNIMAMVGFLPLLDIHENHAAAVEALSKR